MKNDLDIQSVRIICTHRFMLLTVIEDKELQCVDNMFLKCKMMSSLRKFDRCLLSGSILFNFMREGFVELE